MCKLKLGGGGDGLSEFVGFQPSYVGKTGVETSDES